MDGKVLVLDNSKMVRDLMESPAFRESPNWEFILESEPGNFLGRARSEAPLVILLTNADQASGYVTLKALKSHPRTATIPVLLLTQARDQLDDRSLLDLGAAGFIRKPFEFSNLQAQLEDIARDVKQAHDRPELDQLEVVDDELIGLLAEQPFEPQTQISSQAPTPVLAALNIELEEDLTVKLDDDSDLDLLPAAELGAKEIEEDSTLSLDEDQELAEFGAALAGEDFEPMGLDEDDELDFVDEKPKSAPSAYKDDFEDDELNLDGPEILEEEDEFLEDNPEPDFDEEDLYGDDLEDDESYEQAVSDDSDEEDFDEDGLEDTLSADLSQGQDEDTLDDQENAEDWNETPSPAAFPSRGLQVLEVSMPSKKSASAQAVQNRARLSDSGVTVLECVFYGEEPPPDDLPDEFEDLDQFDSDNLARIEPPADFDTDDEQDEEFDLTHPAVLSDEILEFEEDDFELGPDTSLELDEPDLYEEGEPDDDLLLPDLSLPDQKHYALLDEAAQGLDDFEDDDLLLPDGESGEETELVESSVPFDKTSEQDLEVSNGDSITLIARDSEFEGGTEVLESDQESLLEIDFEELPELGQEESEAPIGFGGLENQEIELQDVEEDEFSLDDLLSQDVESAALSLQNMINLRQVTHARYEIDLTEEDGIIEQEIEEQFGGDDFSLDSDPEPLGSIEEQEPQEELDSEFYEDAFDESLDADDLEALDQDQLDDESDSDELDEADDFVELGEDEEFRAFSEDELELEEEAELSDLEEGELSDLEEPFAESEDPFVGGLAETEELEEASVFGEPDELGEDEEFGALDELGQDEEFGALGEDELELEEEAELSDLEEGELSDLEEPFAESEDPFVGELAESEELEEASVFGEPDGEDGEEIEAVEARDSQEEVGAPDLSLTEPLDPEGALTGALVGYQTVSADEPGDSRFDDGELKTFDQAEGVTFEVSSEVFGVDDFRMESIGEEQAPVSEASPIESVPGPAPQLASASTPTVGVPADPFEAAKASADPFEAAKASADPLEAAKASADPFEAAKASADPFEAAKASADPFEAAKATVPSSEPAKTEPEADPTENVTFLNDLGSFDSEMGRETLIGAPPEPMPSLGVELVEELVQPSPSELSLAHEAVAQANKEALNSEIELNVTAILQNKLSGLIEAMVQETIKQTLDELLPEMMHRIVKEELEGE